MIRSLSRMQAAVDVVVAAALSLLFLAEGVDSGITAVVVLVGFGVVLVIRRLAPGPALALSWGLAVVQMVVGLGTQPANVAILCALYSSAAYGSARLRRIGLASVVAGGIVATWYLVFLRGEPYVPMSEGRSAGELVQQLAVILVASWGVLGLSWALGRIALANRMSVEEKHSRALAEVEQERAQHEIAVELERSRIARDMHDIVAHSLAVVIAQADGARYARTSDPDAVDRALTTIASTSRDALRDVRDVLAQLRQTTDELSDNDSHDLETLVRKMHTAGLDVDFVAETEMATLGGGARLTLYRVAQEALTNALRHGDTRAPVVLRLDTDGSSTQLTVRNRLGSGAPASSAGHGLVGMRERAILSGGTFTAGPEDGEWTVVARIPKVPEP
ncbi:sensor histidine kinase [Actinomycetes bacterium M1A6_2h]